MYIKEIIPTHNPILQVEDKSQRCTQRGMHGDKDDSSDKEEILSMTEAEIYITRRKDYTLLAQQHISS